MKIRLKVTKQKILANSNLGKKGQEMGKNVESKVERGQMWRKIGWKKKKWDSKGKKEENSEEKQTKEVK